MAPIDSYSADGLDNLDVVFYQTINFFQEIFESEYQYVNDDMRMMRKNYVDEFWNDNASDDGFLFTPMDFIPETELILIKHK